MVEVKTKDQEDVEAREKELIEEGKALSKLASRSQFRLGKLALEFAPMGERGVPSGAMRRVDLYSESIGVESNTVRTYRNVAHAWSVTDVRDDEFQFAVLKALVRVGDKEKALALLREQAPEGDTTRWKADKALELAHKEMMLAPRRGGRPAVRETPMGETAFARLRRIGKELEHIQLQEVTLAERERLDPMVAVVEAEIGRLRKLLDAARETKPNAKQRRVRAVA